MYSRKTRKREKCIEVIVAKKVLDGKKSSHFKDYIFHVHNQVAPEFIKIQESGGDDLKKKSRVRKLVRPIVQDDFGLYKGTKGLDYSLLKEKVVDAVYNKKFYIDGPKGSYITDTNKIVNSDGSIKTHFCEKLLKKLSDMEEINRVRDISAKEERYRLMEKITELQSNLNDIKKSNQMKSNIEQ